MQFETFDIVEVLHPLPSVQAKKVELLRLWYLIETNVNGEVIKNPIQKIFIMLQPMQGYCFHHAGPQSSSGILLQKRNLLCVSSAL